MFAIGGLIGWAIRSTLPSLIDDFRKRTDSLTKVAESVPVIIKEIGSLVIEVKNDMKLSLSNTEERVISAIQDQKIKKIFQIKLLIMIVNSKIYRQNNHNVTDA